MVAANKNWKPYKWMQHFQSTDIDRGLYIEILLMLHDWQTSHMVLYNQYLKEIRKLSKHLMESELLVQSLESEVIHLSHQKLPDDMKLTLTPIYPVPQTKWQKFKAWFWRW